MELKDFLVLFLTSSELIDVTKSEAEPKVQQYKYAGMYLCSS